jgi:hypothetical protein
MVKRYDLQPIYSGLGIIINNEGNGVLYTDYVLLEQENARLREALTELRNVLTDHPAYASLSEEEELRIGGDTATFSYCARIALQALQVKPR